MTIRYVAFDTIAARNAAIAAVNLAAGFPKRAAVVGGPDGLPSSYSVGAPGWQASLFGTSRPMHAGQDNGHLVPVDSAAAPYLAAGGITKTYSECIFIAGQSNAGRMARPDFSAQDLLCTKFGVDGSGIINWNTATASSTYYESLQRVGRMRPRCVWWIQGEADAATEANALAYEGRLNTLKATYRAQYNDPALPFIICLLNSGATGAYTATVRAAQQAVVAADPYSHAHDMNAYTLVDGLHYGAIGAPAYVTIASDLKTKTLTII